MVVIDRFIFKEREKHVKTLKTFLGKYKSSKLISEKVENLITIEKESSF